MTEVSGLGALTLLKPLSMLGAGSFGVTTRVIQQGLSDHSLCVANRKINIELQSYRIQNHVHHKIVLSLQNAKNQQFSFSPPFLGSTEHLA